VAKRIIWTLQAKEERQEILYYWFITTGNKKYSKKLAFQFRDTIKYIANNNYFGRATNVESIRDTVCGDYLMFYKISENLIQIVSVFDTRRNPKDLKIE
jgi:plasmid stabilization system protein ParE